MFDEEKRTFQGGIARIDLATGEHDLVGGLAKPVGVLARGSELVVSDQEANAILRAPIDGAAPWRPWVASIEGPDLLCAGPSGSLLAGSRVGVVYRVGGGGRYVDLIRGLRAIRGVAYDAERRRAYVVERRAKDGSAPATLHVLPVGD